MTSPWKRPPSAVAKCGRESETRPLVCPWESSPRPGTTRTGSVKLLDDHVKLRDMIFVVTNPPVRLKASALVAFMVVFCSQCSADDWPQFRGPRRDNVSRETGLLRSWPEGGPKRLWLSTNLGSGYSGPAIVGEKIFILGQRADAQWLLCLDAKNGKGTLGHATRRSLHERIRRQAARHADGQRRFGFRVGRRW